MDRGSQLDEDDEDDKDDKEDEEDEEERRRRTRQEEATDIKSNNPHLAGGEKTQISTETVVVQGSMFLVAQKHSPTAASASTTFLAL